MNDGETTRENTSERHTTIIINGIGKSETTVFVRSLFLRSLLCKIVTMMISNDLKSSK